MVTTMNGAKKRLVIAIVWLLCITWLSTKGGIPLPGFSLIGTDKLAHAASYGLLVWLLLAAFPNRNYLRGFGIWLLAASYGALMEWVQYMFFPNRFFEYDDMLANAVGGLLAWIAAEVLKISRKK